MKQLSSIKVTLAVWLLSWVGTSVATAATAPCYGYGSVMGVDQDVSNVLNIELSVDDFNNIENNNVGQNDAYLAQIDYFFQSDDQSSHLRAQYQQKEVQPVLFDSYYHGLFVDVESKIKPNQFEVDDSQSVLVKPTAYFTMEGNLQAIKFTEVTMDNDWNIVGASDEYILGQSTTPMTEETFLPLKQNLSLEEKTELPCIQNSQKTKIVGFRTYKNDQENIISIQFIYRSRDSSACNSNCLTDPDQIQVIEQDTSIARGKQIEIEIFVPLIQATAIILFIGLFTCTLWVIYAGYTPAKRQFNQFDEKFYQEQKLRLAPLIDDLDKMLKLERKRNQMLNMENRHPSSYGYASMSPAEREFHTRDFTENDSKFIAAKLKKSQKDYKNLQKLKLAQKYGQIEPSKKKSQSFKIHYKETNKLTLQK